MEWTVPASILDAVRESSDSLDIALTSLCRDHQNGAVTDPADDEVDG
jgi:hypothetical protein